METLKKTITETEQLIEKIRKSVQIIKNKKKVPIVNSKNYPFSIEKSKFQENKFIFRIYQSYGFEAYISVVNPENVQGALDIFDAEIKYYSDKINTLKRFLDDDIRKTFKENQLKAIEVMKNAQQTVRDNYLSIPDGNIYKEIMSISYMRKDTLEY